MNMSRTEPPTREGSHAKSLSSARRALSRLALTVAAAAVGATLLASLTLSARAADSAPNPARDVFGSVTTAPRLPAGFTKTFKSRIVYANGIDQHAVIGGNGFRCRSCMDGRRTGTRGAS